MRTLEAGGVRGYGAGSEQSELHVVAGGQRELDVSASIDDGAQLGSFSLQQRRSIGDFHDLAPIAYFQIKVDLGVLVQLQDDVGPDGRGETRGFGSNFIAADGKTRKAIETITIAGGRERRATVHVPGGDNGASNSGSRRIVNCAINGGRNLLSAGSGSGNEKTNQRK